MKNLYVHYEDKLVGRLVRDDQFIYSFTYDSNWLSYVQGFPLSLSMPLQTEPFGNRLTLAFFENLLPEGDVMENLKRRHRIEGIMDFLQQFGQDCAGAVTISHRENQDMKRNDAVQELDMKLIDNAIERHESVAATVSSLNHGYLSLAGAQDKFPVIYRNHKFYLPLQGSPTTHIIKTPILYQGIKESVANEYFCMQLAQAVGLPVPFCLIIEGKNPLFMIERYDRLKDEHEVWHRIHQQDFCQALGYTSEEKYESLGGPSLKQGYELVREHVTVRERILAIQHYMDWICFNLYIGNNDSHAKNISLLYRNGSHTLAPFYDLLSTEIYPELDKRFAFVIGDPRIVGQTGRQQFLKLENQLGIKQGTLLKRMKRMGDNLLRQQQKVVDQVEMILPKSTIVKKISRFIEDRYKGFEHHRIFS